MKLTVRQDGPLPGTFLMDRDRNELECAAQHGWGPCFTVYEWEVPTLSIGFHQEVSRLDTERLSREQVPLVRRPTGGAAVLHSEELTYAIVVPGMLDVRAGNLLQEYVGRAISDALNRVGVPAELDERGEALTPLVNRTSCFSRTSRWEIAVQGKKIVGSAQRRHGDALLQHGSILLGDDHLRIVNFLSVSSDADRELLRTRLEAKSTCVRREIGAIEIRDTLREELANAFTSRFPEFFQTATELSVSLS